MTLLFLLSCCRLYRLEQKLDPESAEFISTVRYIITREERKIFLELPQSEREKFIQEFWQRRDPFPETEENEFKTEYFNRIERANELFIGEGRKGWLTDRGRIYVLFGPPTDRIKYPMGGDPYSRCREVWYYGSFPVVFIDQYCNGTYELAPIDLTHLHYLNRAQSILSKTFKKEKGFFDFTTKVKKTVVEEKRLEGTITIEIPYAVIWFSSENKRLVTTLDIHLELRGEGDRVIWEHEEAYVVETDEIELQQKQKKKYRIEIPFRLEEDIEALRRAENKLHIVIKNRTGGEEAEKVLAFKL